jgi:transcriptional regulator with XRE-family HTH domain
MRANTHCVFFENVSLPTADHPATSTQSKWQKNDSPLYHGCGIFCWGGSMSVHKIFAANLRELCVAQGTIADACRGTGINRQQFNRYLSGVALPNSATLAKICAHFGIKDTELFSEKLGQKTPDNSHLGIAPTRVSTMVGVKDFAQGSLRDIWQQLRQLNGSSHYSPIPDGYYYCYFPAQDLRNWVMISLVRIKHEKSGTNFKRLTRFAAGGKALAVGKHMGVVFSNDEFSFLLGKSVGRVPSISLLMVENAEKLGTNLLRGLALVSGSNAPMACNIILQPLDLGKNRIRQVINWLGLVSADSDQISPLIRQFFAGQARGDGVQLSLQSLEFVLQNARKSQD